MMFVAAPVARLINLVAGFASCMLSVKQTKEERFWLVAGCARGPTATAAPRASTSPPWPPGTHGGIAFPPPPQGRACHALLVGYRGFHARELAGQRLLAWPGRHSRQASTDLFRSRSGFRLRHVQEPSGEVIGRPGRASNARRGTNLSWHRIGGDGGPQAHPQECHLGAHTPHPGTGPRRRAQCLGRDHLGS